MQISEIDKNFKVDTQIENENIKWIDCRSKPLELTGLADNEFCRLPKEMLKIVRQELAWLAGHTSGARLRFRTNSSFVALNAELPNVNMMPHMPITGSSGFDLYAGDTYEGFVAPLNLNTLKFEKLITLYSSTDDNGFRDITVNFPLYNDVKSLAIGLEAESVVMPPKATKYEKVVFYGSSITQGGVASRPGNNYANILARQQDFELINLGFSGNAFGDKEIADYIATIPMAAFVMDYDFNSRSLEELRSTHEPMYRKVREAQKDVPIIMITNPVPDIYCHVNDRTKDERRKIVYGTYEKARSEGDKMVWFIDGAELLGDSERGTCTVDNLHPNDLGFFRMATVIGPVLNEALNAKNNLL